jgi:hypothetical protein
MLSRKKTASVMLLVAAFVLAGGLLTYHNLASRLIHPGSAPEDWMQEEDIDRFGKEEDAKSFAIYSLFGRMIGRPEILQQGGLRAEKATIDPKTKHWIVSGVRELYNPRDRKMEPARYWEADVSFSPFAHAWQWHMKKRGKETVRNKKPAMPVTFADLRSMSEMGFPDGRKVTDEDFRYLHGLKALRTLQLGWLDNRWLNEIKDLPNLRRLILANCNGVTDKSLATIGDLTALEELDLSGAPVTDAGLEYLAELPKLRTLSLAGTAVTDRGLKYLKRIKTLSSLDLTPGHGPAKVGLITDAALADLKEFKSLKSVTLTILLTTGNGSMNEVQKFREALQKALPRCTSCNLSIITQQEVDRAIHKGMDKEPSRPTEEKPK